MTLNVEHAGPVTVLTVDRPEARNAVDAPTAMLLAGAIDEFAADDAQRARSGRPAAATGGVRPGIPPGVTPAARLEEGHGMSLDD
jgi:hypothetical protein